MKRTSSLTWVRGVCDMFASQGIDVPALFTDAGLDRALLLDPGTRFCADDVSRLWELAVQRSGNPALGMDRQLTERFVNFDMTGYVMLASPTLKAGLECFSKYLAVISDAATFSLQIEGRNAWLTLGHIGNTRPVPRQRQEYGLLALLTLCRWVTRRELQALQAESTFAEPVSRAPYQTALACPLRFGCDNTRLLLSVEDLLSPLPSSDPAMFAMHQRVIESRLQSLGSAGTSRRVTEEIIGRLHLGEPRREDIAAGLAMADRTLQRRLHEEHTSFAQLLDDARCDLARKYLAEQRYSLSQVADLLGFADQNNFFRAARRWFGMPPGEYRRQVLQLVESSTTAATA